MRSYNDYVIQIVKQEVGWIVITVIKDTKLHWWTAEDQVDVRLAALPVIYKAVITVIPSFPPRTGKSKVRSPLSIAAIKLKSSLGQ